MALVVASAVLMWSSSAPIAAVRAPGPAPVDAVLALGAALLCAALLALVAVGATLSLAAVLTGQVAGRLGGLAQLLTPRVIRAAVGFAIGVTVISGPVAGPAVGAFADAGAGTAPLAASAKAAPTGQPGAPGGASLLGPGWSPDRPAAASPEPRAPLPQAVPRQWRSHRGGGRSGPHASAADYLPPVVVHRGDTLWAIAARHLGRGATDAQVAAEWPRWQAANRSTIGADPDLILPGQLLQAPQSRPTTDHDSTSRASTTSEESP